MNGHDGEGLAKMLEESGMKVHVFASKMKVNRLTPSRWAQQARLPDERLRDAAKVLQRNVEDYIPRFARKSTHVPPADSGKPDTSYAADVRRPKYGKNETPPPSDLDTCQAQLLHWQGKAYDNLELYTKLLQLYMELVKTLPEGSHKALAQLKSLTSASSSLR